MIKIRRGWEMLVWLYITEANHLVAGPISNKLYT